MLFLLTLLGLGLRTVSSVLEPAGFAGVMYITPWVRFILEHSAEEPLPLISLQQAMAVLILGVSRPKSTPFLLLTLYSTMIISQVVTVASSVELHVAELWVSISEVSLTAAIIVTILMMPMRDPELGPGDVAPPFKTPTHHLRSPEDNLSLWQWMTVTWMFPLISVGRHRQLNDEDVWHLPYQFQHNHLHYLFRDIPGTVLMRLLQCNGLDLVITTCLGVFEQVSSV